MWPFRLWAQPTQVSARAFKSVPLVGTLGSIKNNAIVPPARADFTNAVTLRVAATGWHNRRHNSGGQLKVK